MKRKETGARGEKLARGFLRKRGYRILETNLRLPEGEIDIIARQGDDLVFIEVRTKTSQSFGRPEESVTRAKQERLRHLAARYLEEHPDLSASWRIDIVAVELDRAGRPSRLEIIENAIGDV